VGKCSIKKCKSKDIAFEYLGKPICEKCWIRFSEKPSWKLKVALGLSYEEEKIWTGEPEPTIP